MSSEQDRLWAKFEDAHQEGLDAHPERQALEPVPGEYVSTEDGNPWRLTVHPDGTGTATDGRLTIPFDGPSVRYALGEGYRPA